MAAINIVFDGPTDEPMPRLVEDDMGHSVNIGEWVQLDGGRWALRITDADVRRKGN